MTELDFKEIKLDLRAMNERLESMKNQYIQDQSRVHGILRRIYRIILKNGRYHSQQKSNLIRVPLIDVLRGVPDILRGILRIAIIWLILVFLFLCGIGYFTIRSYGSSVDHLLPQKVDEIDGTKESLCNIALMAICFLVIGTIVLLYYAGLEPDFTSIVPREGKDSVLPYIPEHLRDQFKDDLKIFNKNYARLIKKQVDSIEPLDSLTSGDSFPPVDSLPSVPRKFIKPGTSDEIETTGGGSE